MHTRLYLLALICTLFSQPLFAESLTIPGHIETNQKQVVPKRGLKMDAVLVKFGEPNQRVGPVGEPPISEWIYGNFRVYFEYQTVLHTVDLDTLIMPKGESAGETTGTN